MFEWVKQDGWMKKYMHERVDGRHVSIYHHQPIRNKVLSCVLYQVRCDEALL